MNNRAAPTSDQSRCIPAAFTLIEVLAIIVILSMATAVLSVGLVASSDRAKLHAAAASWRDLDAQARIAAQSAGPVRMVLEHRRRTVRLEVIANAEQLSEVQIPKHWLASISVHSRATSLIKFDSRGRSDDYRIELRPENPAVASTIAWRVCGLTGWLIEQDHEVRP